jgi:hypothetical protein
VFRGHIISVLRYTTVDCLTSTLSTGPNLGWMISGRRVSLVALRSARFPDHSSPWIPIDVRRQGDVLSLE